jgi:hypothetical protein
MNRVSEYLHEYVELLRGGADRKKLKEYLESNGLLYGHWSRRDRIAEAHVRDIALVEVFGRDRTECVFGFPIGGVDTSGVIVDDLYDEHYVNPVYREQPDPKWPPMGSFSRLRGPTASQPVPRRPTVFLCHAAENKSEVRALFDRLLADGVTPWFDEVDLMPGDEWEPVITRAIRSSDAVIVCISKTAVTKTGFVQKEIRFALDRADEQPEGKRYIIPVLLEPCRVPERLQKWHYVDLSGPGGYSKLLGAIRDLEAQLVNPADLAP